MWSDTTARNRAHQTFGERHYWWLVGIKALPWLALFAASLYLFGVERVASTIGTGAVWTFGDAAHAVPVLIAFAVASLFLKRRWRRGDYRP